MRVIRLLSLAIAAVAAIAFIGANSASATVLCEETPSGTPAVCPGGSDVAENSTISTSSTKILLTTNITNTECKLSEIKMKTLNTGKSSENLKGEVSGLNFSNCKMLSFPFSSCSVEVKNLPYSFSGSWVSETHNGILANATGTGGNPGARTVCAGFIDCTFGAPAGMELEIKGGNPATVTASEQALTKEAGGFLCPKTSTMHGTYSATGATSAIWFADSSATPPPIKLSVKKTGSGTGTITSSPAGISCGSTCEAKFEKGKEITLTASPSGGSKFIKWSGCASEAGNECKVTMSAEKEVTAHFELQTSLLCKAEAKEGVCPEGSTYGAEETYKAEATEPVFVSSEEDVLCGKSSVTLKGKTQGAPTERAKGRVSSLSFESCKLSGGSSCTLEALNLPYQTELEWTSGSNGMLTVKKTEGGGEPRATVSCIGGALTCIFGMEPTLSVEGGNPAKIAAAKATVKLIKEGGFLKCPAEATFTANYKATSPTAVYVARE